MKTKIYLLLFPCLLVCFVINAQTIRMGARAGSNANKFIVTLRPDFNFNAKLVETGFAVMYPKRDAGGTPIPAPVLSVTNTCATCLNSTFPPLSWQQVNNFSSDPDFYLYKLSVVNPNIGTSPLLTINSGTERDLVEVSYTGSLQQIRLAHLADGGPGFEYGISVYDDTPPPGNADRVNYVQILYGAGLVPASPHPDEGTGYSNTQYVPFGNNSTLPIHWLSFDAIKSGNDALLNWKVSNEENNFRYELLRSVNGTQFLPVATINKTGTGNDVQNYSYTDPGISTLNVPVVYYRLKQIDIDGRSTFSEIRTIRLKVTANISVYPNPVKDGFYVNVPLTGVGRNTIQLNLVNLSGQTVQSKKITALQASNYYFDVKELGLPAGQYNLQIIYEGQVLDTKQLLIAK